MIPEKTNHSDGRSETWRPDEIQLVDSSGENVVVQKDASSFNLRSDCLGTAAFCLEGKSV